MASGTACMAEPTDSDPFSYHLGFGNRVLSEAIPGALPRIANIPQKCPYDLYSEQLNGTSFVSTRATMLHVWMYRIRPAVAHRPMTHRKQLPDLENCFSSQSDRIVFQPGTQEWLPLETPGENERVNFFEGFKTIGGHGDPTQKEGLAVHVYVANADMEKQAFCNNDGDLLIVPQQGRLHIQTELGHIMVGPGELAVIQAGIRFKVALPDGPARGYINEIYGSHFELPEMGPLGSMGMADPRDFQTPVASFDLDESSAWDIVYKLAGKLYHYEQDHTPFDVVAYNGNYVPYKYDIAKFAPVAAALKEQLDPSVYCVLCAKSKIPGVALTEFCVFSPKWVATTNTYRAPYYHRTLATELMGLIYGKYAGSAKRILPGGIGFENSYSPHGETYQRWLETTNAKLEPEFQGEGTLTFMMHMSSHFSLTKYALERHPGYLEQRPDLWSNLRGHFTDHLSEINKILTKAGKPLLVPEVAEAKADTCGHANGAEEKENCSLGEMDCVNGSREAKDANGGTNGTE